MADQEQPRPDAKDASEKKAQKQTFEPARPRETAEERRSKRTAEAIATQADLKREAAERRKRKSDG